MNPPPFERLLDRHGPELFAYLCRMLRQTQEAEDCLQETYLRAFRAYTRLDGRGNYRAWLYKIATNVALTHLKRRSRDDGRVTELDSEGDLAASQPSLDEGAERADLLRRMAAAVERLPVKQRAALVLRNYQQLSYAEVASSLGITPEAARANVYQALKRLRNELEGETQ